MLDSKYPKNTPTGLALAKHNKQIRLGKKPSPLLMQERVKLIAAAHLWRMIAMKIFQVAVLFYVTPRAIPSKKPWMDIVTSRIRLTTRFLNLSFPVLIFGMDSMTGSLGVDPSSVLVSLSVSFSSLSSEFETSGFSFFTGGFSPSGPESNPKSFAILPS